MYGTNQNLIGKLDLRQYNINGVPQLNRQHVIENIFFSGSSYKRRLKISSSVEKTANHPLPQIAFFQSDQSEKISKWCQAGFQRNRTLHLPVSTFSGLLNPYEIKQIVYCQFCPLPQFLLRER